MTAPRWNVIVVVGDDLCPNAVDRMPYLASRPNGNWVTLPNFTLCVPLCGPSRASILTGLYSTDTGVAHNRSGDIPDEHAAWPAILAAHGYFTGLFGKYLNDYPDWSPSEAHRPHGWREWNGFAEQQLYYDQKVVRGGQRLPTGPDVYSTDLTAQWAADFAATAPEPFCLYWAPVAPHSNTTPSDNMVAARHTTLYAGEQPVHGPEFNPADMTGKPAWMTTRYPTQRTGAEVADMDALRVNRWRALKPVDEGLQQIFEQVTARGAWDRTVVIFLGDNGNTDGEYRVDDGKVMPYEICVNAQAMIRWPGAVQRTEPGLVSTVDLAPTLCGLAGARMPSTRGMDLAPLLDGRRTGPGWRRDVYSEWQPSADKINPNDGAWTWIPQWKAIVHAGQYGHLKYVSYETGESELYDLAADPIEMVNLAATQTALAATMQARLDAIAP